MDYTNASLLDDMLEEQDKQGGPLKKDIKYGVVLADIKPTYAIDMWKWGKDIGISFGLRPNFLKCHIIEDRYNKGKKPKKIPKRPMLSNITGVGLLEGTPSSAQKYFARPRLVLYAGGAMLDNRRRKLETLGFRVNDRTPDPYIILKINPNDDDIELAMANEDSLKSLVPHFLVQSEKWFRWY